MPRSRSRSMLSRTWASISRASRAPVASRNRSASVDLPWSIWAMTEKLRMWLGGINSDLSLVQPQEGLRIRGPDVVGARADEAVVRILLEHVRRPAGDPAHGKDRRVEIDRQAERVEHRRGVEVDVRVETLLGLDDLLDAFGHRVPLRLTGLFAERLRQPPEVHRARVLRAVHAMAEAGDLFLPRQLPANDGLGAIEAGRGANLEEQLHDLGIRPAVERSLQGADGGHDGGVDVGQRRGGDARGERRRVELMIGVQIG